MGKRVRKKIPRKRKKKSGVTPFTYLSFFFLFLIAFVFLLLSFFYKSPQKEHTENKKKPPVIYEEKYISPESVTPQKKDKPLQNQKEHHKLEEHHASASSHQKEPVSTPKDNTNNPPVNQNNLILAENEKKSDKKGFLAIIIDDIGFNRHTEKMIINTAFPITLAFLPYGTFTREEMLDAKNNKKEIMLHQPMQPIDKNYNPGHGALYLSMTPVEIEYVFNNNLKEIIYAKGVNNHMGSAFTKNKAQMEVFLEFVREKGLFFVDSFTHPDSVAYETAIYLGIPALKRDIFLDSSINKDEIRKNLYLAVKIAQKKGKAVAIGHPYPETIEVLLHELPDIDRITNLVFASGLLGDSNN